MDVAAVAERTSTIGALLVVDLGAAAAYAPLRPGRPGADVIALDAAMWGGPQLGALVFRMPALLDRLTVLLARSGRHGARSASSSARTPTRMLAGLIASVDHLAALDEPLTGTRRGGCSPRWRRWRPTTAGCSTSWSTICATPTSPCSARRSGGAAAVADAAGEGPRRGRHLAERGICAFADPGTVGVLAHLGAAESGGAVRIGLGHYTTRAETGALVSALSELT